MTDAAPPLDLSDWAPEDIIRRWREAFVWANGREPGPMSYARGWFKLSASYGRREELAAVIWELENRPQAKTQKET